MKRAWSGASPGSRDDVEPGGCGDRVEGEAEVRGGGGKKKPAAARPSRRLPGNARPEGEGGRRPPRDVMARLSQSEAGVSLLKAQGNLSLSRRTKKKKKSRRPRLPGPAPGCPLSPSGRAPERRDGKARPPRPSQGPGAGRYWLSPRSVSPQPLPRLRHARSSGIAPRPPCWHSTWWVGVGLRRPPLPLWPAFSLHTRN